MNIPAHIPTTDAGAPADQTPALDHTRLVAGRPADPGDSRRAQERPLDLLKRDLAPLLARAGNVRPGHALVLDSNAQRALARAAGALAYLIEFQLVQETPAGAAEWTEFVDRWALLERWKEGAAS